MSSQHLSDEAVAAFADGVLTGHARERATRHVNSCSECAHAVKVQREAAWALRGAPTPAPPSSLVDRLRTLPQTTPVSSLPTVVAPDGTTMLATTLSNFAPVAALVPTETPRRKMRPFITTAAVMALAGALAAGSVAHHEDPAQAGPGHARGHVSSGAVDSNGVINSVSFRRGAQP